MRITFFTAWQIGLLVTFGVNYEQRKYVTIEIPFLVIQVLFKRPKNLKMKGF